MQHCNQSTQFSPINKDLERNERRTRWVVLLTFITMVVEIIAGYMTGSMALLADGWHMASHAAALTLTLIVYRLARSPKLASQLTFGTGKLMPLGGYTSAIGLALVAILMAWESVERFISPVEINFNEALWVAIIGLIVNIVSALLLGHNHHHDHHDHDHEDHHHDHSHTHDHNHQAAYIHVIADALTSVAAIVALFIGKYQGAVWLDPLMGIAGSILILKWSWGLLKDTTWELLDGHAKKVDVLNLRNELEVDQAQVLDLHVWRIGPNGVSVQVIVETSIARGVDYYKAIVSKRLPDAHIVIEERVKQ